MLEVVLNVSKTDIVPPHKELPHTEIVAGFTDDMSPGDRVRALRENKGWSQVQLAQEMAKVVEGQQKECDVRKLCGRTHNWEQQGNTPNSDDLELLVRVFCVNEEDIVPGHSREK